MSTGIKIRKGIDFYSGVDSHEKTPLIEATQILKDRYRRIHRVDIAAIHAMMQSNTIDAFLADETAYVNSELENMHEAGIVQYPSDPA